MIGKRRYVTVLFSDVSGSSRHVERLEAEDYAELLNSFRRLAQHIVPRHGGTIARLQGDGVLALFGHLEAHEDDGRRAVEAALELHESVRDLHCGEGSDESLSLHSGVHAGLLLIVDGDIERGRVDVVGEVVNTASRLCDVASPGEILVSSETVGPAAHFFETSGQAVMQIRGRSAPLSVLRVNGRAALGRRIDASAQRGLVPFYGRASTLDTLLAAAEHAPGGEGSALLVIGEPGIGKTRLIEEFIRRLDDRRYRVLRGYCESYLGAEPLQPFMQMLRAAVGWRPGRPVEENEARVEEALSGLAHLPATVTGAALLNLLGGGVNASPLSAEARVETIVQFLAAFNGSQTTVLFLDDWQWADDASRQTLDALRQRRLPMLCVLAARSAADDENMIGGAIPLRLGPLEFTEADEAITAWLPDADPFVTREIYRQSGGSPLFIEELCHAVAAAGGNIDVSPRTRGMAWIGSLIASRLARLPDAEAECLRQASVVGNVFDVSVVAQLAGQEHAHALLEALMTKDFLIDAGQPGALRFKHVLTRDAVYATVDAARRTELHLRVAELLRSTIASNEAFEWLEALSFHYDAAGKSEEASRFAEAAGDKALAAMALDRARAQYIVALHSLDAMAPLSRDASLRWCSIAQRLGQTCVFDPLDVASGLVLFERAGLLAREAGDANAVARAEYWLAYVNYGKGRPRAAIRHGEVSLQHALSSGDTKLAAQVQATLAQAHASAGQYDRAMPLFLQAVESKRQQSRPGGRTAIGSAYTLGRMGFTFGDLGRFDEAQATFDEAMHLLGDATHSVAASVLELMSAVHIWQGRWDDAERVGLQGADMALRCRSRYLTAMGRALAACASWARDRDAASLSRLRDATRWIEARGGAVSTSLNYGWLVEASDHIGESDSARRWAIHLFQRARVQDRHGLAHGCRVLGARAALAGDRQRAERYFAAADQAAGYRSSRRERAVNDLWRGRAAWSEGRATEARSLAEASAEAFEDMQMTWHVQRSTDLMREL